VILKSSLLIESSYTDFSNEDELCAMLDYGPMISS